MPKIVERAARRSEFVAAGMAVIAREGLHGATLRTIAAQAGCTTGAIMHHFSGRDDLLFGILDAVCTRANERIAAVAQADHSDFARLEGVVLQGLPLDRERYVEWRIWLALWTGAAAGMRDFAADNDRRYREWRAIIEMSLAPLCPDSATVGVEVSLLSALIDGMGLQLVLLDEDDDRMPSEQRRVEAEMRRYLQRYARPAD